MGKKEKILDVLADKDLTSIEIKLELAEFQKNCYELQTYLARLHKEELIYPIKKEGRCYVYRSIVRDSFFILDEVANHKKIKKELKKKIYEVIVKLLPSYLEKQLDTLLQSKTQSNHAQIKDLEKIKNLLYS